MNIFTIPYTWLRHFAMALWCAGAGLMGWWIVLTITVRPGFLATVLPEWPPSMDGPLLMGTIAACVSGASVLGQANLERWALWKRFTGGLLGVGLAVLFTVVWYNLWHHIGMKVVFSGDAHADHIYDSSLVSLRYRIGAFCMGGLSSGLGPMLVRKGAGWPNHIVGGFAAGLTAAAVWHLLGAELGQFGFGRDLYLGGAAFGFTWGWVYGLFVWGIPDDLYAGWIRVLTPHRYGRRIPVDALDGSPKERFIGSWSRGLDLHLSSTECGVQKIHLSVRVDSKQRYAARGLSLQFTRVKRFLERIDLRYDPRRPAPLETRLSSGDRMRIGDGQTYAEVEFIMLPKEES